jgi:hypothetical protein
MAKQNVHNNQARKLVVLLAKRLGEDGKPIERVGRELVLDPGLNSVDSDLLAAARNHPGFKQWSQLGWITMKAVAVAPVEADDEGDGGEGSAAPADLSKLKAGEAIELVNSTDSLDTLERWVGTEQRQTVVKALTERIADLEGDGGEGSDEDDDAEE